MRNFNSRGRFPCGAVRVFTFAVCIGAALWGGPGCAFAAEGPIDLATLVPPNVDTSVFVRSVPELLGKVRGSAFSRFYADPAKAGFLGPLRGTLESGGDEISKLIASAQEDYACLSGPLLMAKLDGNGGKDGKGGGTDLFIAWHNDAVRARALLGGGEIKRGLHARSEQASSAGMAYERITRTQDAKPKKPKGGAIPGAKDARPKEISSEFIFVNEHLFIRGRGSEAVFQAVLARVAKKGLPVLADSTRRRAAVAPWSEAPDIEVFYDLAGRAERGHALIDAELLGRGGNAAALGANDIQSAAAGLWFLPERLKFETSVYIPATRRGIGGLFFLTEPLGTDRGADIGDIRGLIPRDALGYAAVGADLGRFWNAMRRIFQRGAPGVLHLMDSYLGALNEGLDENLQDEVLRRLGARWMVYTRKSVDTRRREPDSTYVFEVSDPDGLRPVLERWLRKTAETLNYDFDTSEVRGRHFYRLRGAEQSAGSAVKVEQVAKACLAGRWLYFSPRFEHIEASLAALDAEASRAEAVTVRGGLGDLPANRSIELWSSPKSYRTLSKDPFLSMFSNVFSGLSESMVAMDSAPGDDAIAASFAAATGAMSTDQEHVMLRMDLEYSDKK